MHSKATTFHLLAQKLRNLLGMNFWESKSIQSIQTCTIFEGRTIQKFWAHFSRRLARVSRYFPAGYSVQSLQKFWHKFLDSLYNIYCWDSRTVRISRTEIEELIPDSSEGVFVEEEG